MYIRAYVHAYAHLAGLSPLTNISFPAQSVYELHLSNTMILPKSTAIYAVLPVKIIFHSLYLSMVLL